jgi:hypothetical protein
MAIPPVPRLSTVVGPLIALACLLMGILGPVCALDALAETVAPVSVASLARELTDLTRLPLSRPWSAHLDSSYDRTGGNKDQQNFLAMDGETALLADLHGPGALVRIWTTSVTTIGGHLTSFQTGILKVYIDDQVDPVVSAVCGDLFTGKIPPFTPPLTVINGAASYTYLPIPFAHHCRVTIDRPAAEFFYQINAIRLPAGSVVRPFALPLNDEDEQAVHAAAAAWTHAALAPSASAAAVSATTRTIHQHLAIPSGRSIEVPAILGPGTVAELGLAAPHVSDAALRQLVLRLWFDGHTTPDIEAPVADFFGNAFGHAVFSSLLIGQDSSGMMTCRLPMPFASQLRIRLDNGATEDAAVTLALTLQDRGPQTGGFYLHADFNQEITISGKAHAWARIRGSPGQFVGVVQAMQSARTLGFCEGDDQVRVDDEVFVPAGQYPTVIAPWNGTGTEDCFNSAWYYGEGVKAQPVSGCLVKQHFGRIDTFRFFLNDAPVFRTSLDAQLEHGGTNDGAGDYYSSVAFWYGPGERIPLMPFPPASSLCFPTVTYQGAPIIIEGESLVPSARTTGGTVRAEVMHGLQQVWSGDQQLRWSDAQAGQTLTVAITPPTAGTYRLSLLGTKGPGYGTVSFAINGQTLPHGFDGHAPALENAGLVDMGVAALPAGPSPLTITLAAGTTPGSRASFGLDLIALHPESPPQTAAP